MAGFQPAGGKGVSKAPDGTRREVMTATVVEALFKTGRQDAPLTGRQRCPPLRDEQSGDAPLRKNSRTALPLTRHTQVLEMASGFGRQEARTAEAYPL